MQTVWALCVRNLKDFVRNKARLVLTLVFPFFFIYIFSAIFQMGDLENPISVMLVGIAIATVFDVTLRISSSTIEDMASGFMKEVLVSPVSRLSIAGGQFLSGALIATIQGLIILLGGVFLGFRISQPITVLYIILAMMFIGFVFAGFGLFLATKTKSTQTFQIVSVAITMPMTFLSGAYIMFNMLPRIPQIIGYFNPLTYAVSFFRAVSLEGLHASQYEQLREGMAIQIGDFVVTPLISALFLLGFGALFLLLATWSFVKTDFSKVSRGAGEAIEW